MNCLEFRRLADIDPDSQDVDFIRHKAECESCAAFAARAARFSGALEQASRVEVPENLASRVLLKQSFLSSGSVFSRRRAVALAAGIVAAAGLAASALFVLGRPDPLAREIFTLIDYADYAMKPKAPVAEQAVAKAVSRAGLELSGTLEKVTFAGNCLLRQKIAGHLVIQGDRAPITVFLIRELEVPSETTIRGEKLWGLVVPVESGAVVVVGAPEESLAAVARRIRAAVRWRRA